MTTECQQFFVQYAKIFFFVIGYIAIIFEHPLGINKTTSALLMAVIVWALNFSGAVSSEAHLSQLNEHLANIAQVIVFLLGALTIVEQINVHGGLGIISRCFSSTSGPKLVFIVSAIAFLLSSFLDNLTTTIVMIMILRKCLHDTTLRLLFGGTVVIAANAGGAWTPIGDVTTTMLWIGDRLSSRYIISSLFLPSLACALVAAFLISRSVPKVLEFHKDTSKPAPKAKTILVLGSLSLVSVPFIKYATGLPPFMGMLFAMSCMWLFTDLLHRHHTDREHLKIPQIFPKVDISGILFFLGILLAVSGLESAGILTMWAEWLNRTIPSQEIIACIIGVISAVIDNVPIVAACMGMYGTMEPLDSPFWSLIAYCAGTGGSMLIIGSAAGVAFMSLEKVDFFWYARRVGIAAMVGYFSGLLIWGLQTRLVG